MHHQVLSTRWHQSNSPSSESHSDHFKVTVQSWKVFPLLVHFILIILLMSPKNKGKDIKGWLKEFGQFQRDNVFVLLPNLNMDMPVQKHRTSCHVLKPVEMIVCDWVKLRSLVSIPLQVCHLDQVPFHSLSSSYLCLLPPYSSALPDSVTVLHPSSYFSSPTVHYKPLPCLSLTVLLPISLTDLYTKSS